jgi:alpha-1,2-mannosyltransferase
VTAPAPPPTSRPTSWTRRLAGLLALAALSAWLFTARAAARMPDFEVYWRAGTRAAAAEPLYRAADADYQFKYFPAFAVAMRPLAALPLPAAKAAWFAASFAAWVALLALVVRLLPARRRSTPWIVGALLVGLGKYYVEDLVLGQINIVLTLVVALAVAALAAGRETLGGALVGIAIVVKPYALILTPWLGIRGDLRAIAAAGAVGVVAVALPALTYGWHGAVAQHLAWWQTVTQTTAGVLTHSNNISVASMFAKWLGPGPAATALTALASGVLLGVGAVLLRRRAAVPAPDLLDAGLLLALTPLLSPQGWDYVAVVATLAVASLADHHDQLPRQLRLLSVAALLVVGLTLYDLLGRRLVYLLLDHGAVTVGALGLVAAGLALRLRRLA